jgi:transposase
MSLREAKGRDIADKFRIVQSGNLWLVPSQSSRKSYKVDPAAGSCTCPDYEYTGFKCKHQYAVEFTVKRETKTTTKTDAKGQTTTTVTETKTVTRKTYPQVWPAYNQAQTQEKAQFMYLLHQLCQGIGSPAQHGPGQRCLPLEDVIFSMAFKVYSTLSTRRFMTDLRDAQAKGYLSQLPSYNSIIRYFESEMLTDYLMMLIEESSLPLQAIEQDFAVDSSGLSTCRFVQWVQAKYTDPQLMEKRDWIKIHICCGVTTNVVTAVRVTDRNAADIPHFEPLVKATAENFALRQVSADKAYLSGHNLKVVVDNYASPYIPFKINSNPNAPKQSALWKSMYHFYAYNQERFMANYHKRSNVESTFMMIKAKFGDSLRSKLERAQINEALCKILCHNICCVIQSMYELGLKPKFWKEVA